MRVITCATILAAVLATEAVEVLGAECRRLCAVVLHTLANKGAMRLRIEVWCTRGWYTAS